MMYQFNTQQRNSLLPWRTVRFIAYMILLVVPLKLYGCIHAHCRRNLSIVGQLVDAGTLQPIEGAALGARSISDGATISETPPSFRLDGVPRTSSDVEGSFSIFLTEGLLSTCPPPDFTRPDQVEIIVLRDGCEQRFMIEVNQDTVVDLSFPNRTLELREPILVPPCEEPAGNGE
jgi:hypothetical protein